MQKIWDSEIAMSATTYTGWLTSLYSSFNSPKQQLSPLNSPHMTHPHHKAPSSSMYNYTYHCELLSHLHVLVVQQHEHVFLSTAHNEHTNWCIIPSLHGFNNVSRVALVTL